MIYERLVRKLYALEDLFFEKSHKFNLSGNINSEDLISSHITKVNAYAYQPVFIATLRKVFREANKLGCNFENFIDIGSGKGKACLYASEKGLFKHVIGVEFSMELVDIANQNKENIKVGNIEFLHSDASNYILPDTSNLIFLFNPFDETILEKFIVNNTSHFQRHHSVIAYANDVHHGTLIKLGFMPVYRNQSRKISLYKTAPVIIP